ncbi:hypothetical protein [Pseudomonas atacamensis]|uniref:hypothetical protein n=1 Tax=Pseudomonas atacamensis TaxID=2565368 RepID=UPI003CF8E755
MVELLAPPDLVPVASVLSLAAKLAADAVASRPANNNEVNLRVIMVRLLIKGDYLILVLHTETLVPVE